ncbi:MAG TPA: hypothetical protein VH054_05105, partial [Polyangiaceae bacterium]|nr:hypothetical protein [Polyangiaceae bacterium]
MLLHCGARTDLGGTAPDSCASVTPTSCAKPVCTGGTCIATVADQPTYGIAIDDEHVFWTTDGALMRADKCGANATVLVGCARELSIRGESADDVYFVQTSVSPLEERLLRVSKNGGPPLELATFDADIWALAVENDAIFVTVTPENSIEGRI